MPALRCPLKAPAGAAKSCRCPPSWCFLPCNPYSSLASWTARVGCAQARGQAALQQSLQRPAGAPDQPRPSHPEAPPPRQTPPRGSRHGDVSPARAQCGRTPGRSLGIMISAGCGVPAVGRELSTPRPLRTDARLPAEVGRVRRAGRERGQGLRFSSAAASEGLGGRRRRRKVSCALGPGRPARRTRPAAPPRPRAPTPGLRASRGPALPLRPPRDCCSTGVVAAPAAGPGRHGLRGPQFPRGPRGPAAAPGVRERPPPHAGKGTRLSVAKGARLRKGQQCGSPGTARIFFFGLGDAVLFRRHRLLISFRSI